MKAEHWAGSQTVEEWSILVSGTSVFGTVCNWNAWDCIWPKQGIACWMFCVVFTKTGLSELSLDYFRGQA